MDLLLVRIKKIHDTWKSELHVQDGGVISASDARSIAFRFVMQELDQAIKDEIKMLEQTT